MINSSRGCVFDKLAVHLSPAFVLFLLLFVVDAVWRIKMYTGWLIKTSQVCNNVVYCSTIEFKQKEITL